MSPTRLIVRALIADLLACSRVNQKLISRYEDTPIPSHKLVFQAKDKVRIAYMEYAVVLENGVYVFLVP